ncbi:unnamed protein product [Lathyrus sativus]|nr:unnamed protein product [Lathyrus sativus]
MMLPDPSPSDSSLLLCLPDDVFATVSRFLIPREVFNLSLCCKSLYALATSEKVWFTQCDIIGIVSHKDLVEWREYVSSYKVLCRFLSSVKPLIGIWVQQNPELGNLVYVMPGFVSVVACRIIPQEIVSSGSIQDGSILWSPVFEIVCDFDGSSMFLLHGREEKGIDCVYHGSVKCVNRFCNLLLLEVESLKEDNNEGIVPFSKLGFRDRKKLLEVTTSTSQVRLEVPNYAYDPLFRRSRDDYVDFQKDLVLLKERREFLIQMTQMYKLGCIQIENRENSQEEEVGSMRLQANEVRKSHDYSKALSFPPSNENSHTQCIKRKSFGGYFWDGFKHILGRSRTRNDHMMLSSSHETKHDRLQDFLKSSDTLRLTLKALTANLSCFRGWPNMNKNWFALYKMPLQVPKVDQVYAGLWGGTFGWPHEKSSQDKPRKALFFLLLSYSESKGQQFLIGTKILEGTCYAMHPNGSAMFTVNINEPSSDPFPSKTDRDSSSRNNIEHAFMGEGIANGYGFKYPGSKPGSLFAFQNGDLAFVWKESRDVLTLQRLNLQELLKKGKRIPSLPPIDNFSYLMKSCLNVFTS